MSNIVRLKGEHVNLCILRTDDEAIDLYTKWENDETINHYVGNHNTMYQRSEEKEWAEKKRNEHQLEFNIIEKDSQKLIGNCNLYYNNISAYLGILIGEESGRDKGYGTEVIKLLVKYAFETLNMHRVELNVNGENERAIRCYKKAGFKVCATYHEAVFYENHYSDILGMEILRKDYDRQSK